MTNQRVRAGANHRDNAVKVEHKLAALNQNRTAAAGCVRLAQLHLLALEAGDVEVLVRQHLERRGRGT